MARQRRNRLIGVAVVVVIAAAAVVFAVTRPKPKAAETQANLLAQAPAAASAAGCGKVQDVGPYQPESQDQAHVDSLPPFSSYPSQPPASGPHSASTTPPGVYSSPPNIGSNIHSLEHGAAIVWYDPTATGPALQRITSFYNGPQGDRVIVAPYDFPDQGAAGRLPTGIQMALVSWHHVQYCADVSLPVAFDFTAHYAAPPYQGEAYRGDAPEAGAPF